jgi:hypothetical protein
MGLLERLGQDIAQRKIEVLAVVFPRLAREHGNDRAHRVFPDRALVAKPSAERVQLGDARALAHPELDAPVREQVERAHALGDPRRVIRGELDDSVREANATGALARGGEEDLGRRGVGVLLEEVMLDLPRVVVAEPVGELDLVERVVQQLVFASLVPRPGELVLVEDPELHRGSSLRFLPRYNTDSRGCIGASAAIVELVAIKDQAFTSGSDASPFMPANATARRLGSRR